MNPTLLREALALREQGYAPLPIRPDGSKAPAVAWAAYRDTAPDPATVATWFDGRLDTDGLGIITGPASGQLEMLEAEGRAINLVPQLAQLLADHGLHDVWTTLNAGWVELTPGGGMHWHYRVTDGPARPNTKLARRPATPDELATSPGEKVKVLFETRGAGGFTVLAPSAGRTHSTGRAWTRVAGGPATCPTITAQQRDALHAVTNLLDAMPTPEPAPATAGASGATPGVGTRPGDDYNARTSWDDILTPLGWTKGRRLGDGWTWTRPGKNPRDGISATTGTRGDGADRLYVFTTSTEFEAEKPYTKFSAYALLEHGGDYTAAAKELASKGYGTPTPISPGNTTSLHDLASQHTPPETQRPTLTVIDGNTARIIEPLDSTRLTSLYGPTEDGVARALADLHRDALRYCPQRSQWLHWTGSRWEWDLAGASRELTKNLSRDLPETDQTWKNFKRRALSANGVDGILRQARTDPRINVHIDALDAQPYELNTPAGIIDLRTGTLRPADPAALHTRTTAVTPDYTHPAPTFTHFLADTFASNTDLTTYVQRLFGLSAIGTVLEQILPFGLGGGANGKSTLAEAVMHTLGRGDGGYAISAPSEMLMVRRHSEHPAELAQLAGARLVICSELDDGQRFAEARIKQLTGRDSINARFMRQDPFTFTPTHTIWLLGNHKPGTTAGGPAFWRRLHLIPFDNVVPEKQRDPRLNEKLAEEAPAILAWIARGAADYLTHGLGAPTAVTEATASYAADQDTVGRFVEDSCHLGPAHILSCEVGTMRAAYEAWCTESGETPVSAKRLTQELRDRFAVEPVKGSAGRRHYTGIAPTSSATGDDSTRWFDR